MYINVRATRLSYLQKNRLWLFCKELFVVRHKSIYSCKRTIFFYLDKDIIKCNCDFTFYNNKTDTTSTVLDGGNEIISSKLAKW